MITPNLLLILTMSFGLMRGRKEGLLVGACSGLLVDIIFLQHPRALYAFVTCLLVILTDSSTKNYMIEDVLLPLIVIIVDDFLFNTIIYIVSFLLKNKNELRCIPSACYSAGDLCTALLTVIIYKLYVKINKRLKEDE